VCNRHRTDGVQLFASFSLFERCLNVIGRGIQQARVKLALRASDTLAHLFRFVLLLYLKLQLRVMFFVLIYDEKLHFLLFFVE